MATATPEETPIDDVKASLLDSFYGIERGLAARGEARADINELISQLEARNPTPAPNEALALLDGTWRLMYTTSPDALALLALGRLPLVSVGDITQSIDSISATVTNTVSLSVPLSRTELSTTARFEVRSPKILQIQFQQGKIATPEITADLEIPSSVDLLGQSVDLTQLRSILEPGKEQLTGLLEQLGGLLSRAPGLEFPLAAAGGRAQAWLLTTYLDDGLRICRGDGGSVFVLTKELFLVAQQPAPLVETNQPPPLAVVEPVVVEPESSPSA